NPTAAQAPREFYERAIELAGNNDIIIAHDAAYSELYFDGRKPLSFLDIDGAREVGIELHSLSKTYNMTGWRIGYAVGNKDVVAGLTKIKSNLDSGPFQAVQEAAITALDSDESVLEGLRETYQARRDALYDGLSGAGFDLNRPDATFYLWMKVPEGQSSADYAGVLLEKAGVLATPGSGFGAPIPEYRVSIVADVYLPGLKVKPIGLAASLNHNSFRAGEEAQVKIRVGRDSVIAIFNIMADDQVVMLFPNNYAKGNLVKGGIDFVFPGEGSGIALTLSTLAGHERDAEAVFVSAIDPEAGAKLDALFKPMKPMSLSEFFSKYSKIADYAEDAVLAYEVVAAE
ncbi:hypothetical protein LCGC14_2355820, partial [marine sediment metagenome]